MEKNKFLFRRIEIDKNEQKEYKIVQYNFARVDKKIINTYLITSASNKNPQNAMLSYFNFFEKIILSRRACIN